MAMASFYKKGSNLRDKLSASPEAMASEERGMALTKPQPITGTVRPDYTPEDQKFVPPSNTGEDPDKMLPQVTPQPTQGPRLQLGGKSFTEQARLLGDFLKKYNVGRNLTVGGTSQYDTDIISLLDRINDPNTQDAELQHIAEQISQLAGLREGSAKDAQFTYDPFTGEYRSAVNPSGFDRGKLTGIIDDYLKGTGSKEQENTERAALSDSVLGGALQRKQGLANKLSSQGVHGGAALDTLSQVDTDVEQALAAGLRDISLGSIQRRHSERDKALEALTGLAGLDSQDRYGQETNDLNRLRLDMQNTLGRDEADRLWAQLDLGGLTNDTTRRGQDMGLLSDLIGLYSRAEGEDKALLLELIQGLT